MEPISAGMFASIGSAFKFAEVALRIGEVGSENAVFVRTIQVVREDLEEVERLLSLVSVQKKLLSTPGKLSWIKQAVRNTRCALSDIGKWVERARVEQETTGFIRFETRLRWVFNDHEKLLNRKTELSTCHQQLSIVLTYLAGLEVISADTTPPKSGDTTSFEDVLSRDKETSGLYIFSAQPDIEREAYSKDTSTKTATVTSLTSIDHTGLGLADVRSQRTIDTIGTHREITPQRLTSLSSMMAPPNSPPPTYTAAVLIDPVFQRTRMEALNHNYQNQEDTVAYASDDKGPFQAGGDNIWAHRGNFEGINVPELAGDAISFSGTNSAGPVNPHGWSTIATQDDSDVTPEIQSPSDVLVEMLGDLNFPPELPGITYDSGASLKNSTQSRANPERLGLTRSRNTQWRKRTTSETLPVRNRQPVHRRPVPTNALSDSLLTIHEFPSYNTSVALQRDQLPLQPSVFEPLVTELPLRSSTQPQVRERHASLPIQAPTWPVTAQDPTSNVRHSAPPPLNSFYNERVAAFSAESTSSWGLDTQPNLLKAPTTQEPRTVTRMHSRRQMMDLLGSIEK